MQSAKATGLRPLFRAGFFVWKKSQFEKLFIKSVALTLVFTFTYTQLLWAIDVRQLLVNAKLSFEEEEMRRGDSMTAAELAGAQANQQAQVEQQQALQDLQASQFTLKTAGGDTLTYVGDKLQKIQRPDGTMLKNLRFDAQGNLSGADLKLSDGSVQVYQNGVLGYKTPDGTDVVYENGRIAKTVSRTGVETVYSYALAANGAVVQTTLESPTHRNRYDAQDRLTESTVKSTGDVTRYRDGILQRIDLGAGGAYVFKTETAGEDLKVTFDHASDAAGNKFYYDGTSFNAVEMVAGGRLDGVVWDADSSVKDAIWVDADGSRYTYTAKKLTQWTNAAGQLHKVTYSGDLVVVETAGLFYEYRADGTLVRTHDGDFSKVAWFYTDGPFKGLMRHSAIDALSEKYYAYEYILDSSGVVIPQRREIFLSPDNNVLIKGLQPSDPSTNPQFKTTFMLPLEEVGPGFFDPADLDIYAYTGTTTTRKISIDMDANKPLTYSYGGSTKTLSSLVIQRGVSYDVEMRWEADGVGLYVSPSGTPVAERVRAVVIPDKNWSPRFQASSKNIALDYDRASSGAYAHTYSLTDGGSYLGGNPQTKVDFKLADAGGTLTLTATQYRTNSISRTMTFEYASGRWTLKTSDYNSATGATTVTTSHADQSLLAGTEYAAELRMGGGYAKLYVYDKGASRPATPIASLAAFNASTKLKASGNGLAGYGQTQRNLYAPTLASVQARPFAEADRLGRVQNLALRLPAVATFGAKVEFAHLVFDAERRVKEILKKDGSKLVFEQGLLKEAYDPAGALTTFAFEESSLANVVGVSLKKGGASSEYDAAGNLKSFKVGDITVHYKEASTDVDYIEKEDGTEYHDLVFDATGQITGAYVVDTAGDVRIYEAGKLKYLRKPDQTRIFYSLDKPVKMITPKGFSYTFVYQADRIEAVLDSPETVSDSQAPTMLVYDFDFNLKRAVRKNQEILHYSEGRLSRVDFPESPDQILTYLQDGYRVDQNDVESFYDADNRLVRSVIKPSTENPHTIEAVYRYDKIREVRKDGFLTLRYSYPTDAEGRELSVVEDLENGVMKTFRDGVLLTSFDPASNVLSAYEYVDGKVSRVVQTREGLPVNVESYAYAGERLTVTDDNGSRRIYENSNVIETFDAKTSILTSYAYVAGKVSRVRVSRLGRQLHVYDYSYTGTLTIVRDDEGAVRTYTSNKKLLLLEKDGEKKSFSYWPDNSGEEIVEERLVERRLQDGTLVRYQDGAVSAVVLADGTVLSEVTLDDGGAFTRATATLATGEKKIFNAGGLVEEIFPSGLHLYYENGRLAKAEDPALGTLFYTYDLTPSGGVAAVWVERANLKFKYDAGGALIGANLPGVATPEEILAATQHAYEGGGTGAWSHDGDFNTAQVSSASGGNGGVGAYVYSTHTFPSTQNVTEVKFRMYASAYAYGNYIRDHSVRFYVETLKNGTWSIVPGSYGGGGCCEGSTAVDSQVVTLSNVNLEGVQAIRAFASGFGNASGGEGSAGGTAAIYDIQFRLADQAWLAFQNLGATGYRLSGAGGSMSFGADGVLQAGYTASLESHAAGLDGKIQLLSTVPQAANLTMPVPAAHAAWMEAVQDSALDRSKVTIQEYSASGSLEAQVKADGTVTLFEDNKPKTVLDRVGRTIMEYTYDAAGNVAGVKLKHARDSLPAEVADARKTIEEQRASTLKDLAAQRNLAYQSIYAQAQTQRDLLNPQLLQVQEQYNGIAKTSVKGKQARGQKSSALELIGGSLGQIKGALAAISLQEADAYAALDAQVKAVSDQIVADAERAYTELNMQETALKRHILRQESSPIIYDHYRRVLGRDPSAVEYEAWLDRLDYETGNVFEGWENTEDRIPGASIRFNGGNYLSVQGSEDLNVNTGDFTVDGWFRFNGTGPAYLFHQTQTGGSGTAIALRYYAGNIDFYMNDVAVVANAAWTPTPGEWYHVAVSRASGSVKVFVNGVQKGASGTYAAPVSSASRFHVGAGEAGENYFVNYFNGWADEFRFTKGLARWTGAFTPSADRVAPDAATKLLLRATAAGYSDAAAFRPIFAQPSVAADGAVFKTTTRTASRRPLADASTRAGASVRFDGAGDYAAIADDEQWNFGSGDFTVDTWVKFDTVSSYDTILSQGTDSMNYMNLKRDGTGLAFYAFLGNSFVVRLDAADTLAANTWYHVALVRSGNSIRIYRDGVLKGSAAVASAIPNYTGPLVVGTLHAGSTDYGAASDANQYFQGSIDELRVTRGVARWTGPFSMSANRYEKDGLTGLLFRASAEGAGISDETGKAVTLFGDTANSADHAVLDVVRTPRAQTLPTALSEHLNALPELAQRTAYVSAVKTRVTDRVRAFLAMTQAEKEAFASTLGLSTGDLVALSNADAEAILEWLNSRSLHFGQSAFLSLEALLDQKGISYAREDIAEKAILVDVLTGILSPLDDGDLVLSLFSLNRVASLYGLSLLEAQLTYDDLKALYASPVKAIAHVQGNHFVVVTAVTDDSVTYVDTGIGADKANESVTVSKKDFLKIWKGAVAFETAHVTVASGVLKTQANVELEGRQLTKAETQKIRGAFLGLLIVAVWGAIQTVGAAVWAVLNAIGAVLAQVGALVANALQGIGAFLGNLANGIGYIGQQLFAGIKFAASALFGQNGFFATVANQAGFGSLGKATFGEMVFSNALRTGLSFAVRGGLEALGLNPQIASFAASFAGGNPFQTSPGWIMKSFNPFTEFIKAAAPLAIQTLVQKLDLDPILKQTLTFASGAVIDGYFEGNIGASLIKVAPKLTTNFAFYGLEKLSIAAGFDPMIGTLIGAPILGAINTAFQGVQNVGETIVRGIRDSFVAGAIGYGVKFATGSISNPILGSLASRILAGSLEGALFSGNLFSGFFQAAKNSVLDLFGRSRQEILSNIVKFTVLVSEEGGIGEALDTYAKEVFDRTTVESVLRSGGFVSALLAPKTDIMLPTGQAGKETILSSGASVLFDAQGNFIGFKRGGVFQLGEFGLQKSGEFGLLNGEMYGLTSDGRIYSGTVRDGQAITITIDVNGEELKIGGKDDSALVFSQTGDLIDGTIDYARNAYSFVLTAGNWSEFFVSTAHAETTVVGPNGQIIPIKPIDPIRPDVVTATRTRKKGTGPQYLVRFMNRERYDALEDAQNVLSANLQGQIFTTDFLRPDDIRPEYAATTLQLGDPSTGLIDKSRADYFVVFDVDELSPPPPQGTFVAKQYAGYEEIWQNAAARQEVVFTDRPFIDLKEITRYGIRLVHKGATGFIGIVNAYTAMIARGIRVE